MHLCKVFKEVFIFFIFQALNMLPWFLCRYFIFLAILFVVHPKLSLDNYTICKRKLQPKQKTIEISILTIVVRHVTRLNPLHCTVCK